MKYLLDTNVISEARKQKPHGAVVAWLRQVPDDSLLLPAVVLGEIQAGVERAREQDPVKAGELELWVDTLSSAFQVIPMDAACFREWARLMHRNPGQWIVDAMIAATARVYGLTVATRNERDFTGFKVLVFNPFKS